jgi:hypothetical protein
MTILYDLLGAQPIGSSKFHGGGEYIKIVLKKLIEMHSNTNRIIVFYDCDRFLDEWVKKLIEEKEIAVYDVKTIFDVEKIFIIEKINVFYSGLPYDYYKIKTPINVKKIGTVHGMLNIKTPTDLFV